MRRTIIPKYFVYGEPERPLEPDFVHIELVSDRKNLHSGQVEAHRHSNLSQLIAWTKGGGTYLIEDRAWTFSAPALCWIPSGTVHGFHVSPASDAISLSIADGALATVPNYAASLSQTTRQNPDWLELKNILAILRRQHSSRDHDALLPLASLSLHFAGRLLQSTPHSQNKRALAQKLRSGIDKGFRGNLKVGTFVKSVNSTYHIADRTAHEAFGVPIKRLISERRMLEAKRLLKFTIRPAKEIAFELGFDDPAYFNRAFKKYSGLSPIAWRNQA